MTSKQDSLTPAQLAAQLPRTDLHRWRLKCKEGEQQWHYLETDEECKAWPQTVCDRYWLGLPTGLPETPPAKTPLAAAQKGIDFYKHLQTEDGHFAGEYGGPLFLLPGMCIAYYVTKTPIPEPWRIEIIRYLVNVSHPEGGWGLHIEGHPTVFGTATNYVALRILGLKPNHPVMVKARAKLHQMGGAVAIPSWGKFWLSVLNVYKYEGMNPVPPELWLMPEIVPFHPWRYWVHTRMVYLPMGYLYGRKYQCEETELIRELRQELYIQPYEKINWAAARNDIAEEDVYVAHHIVLDFLYIWLNLYEKVHLKSLREKALRHAYKLIVMEEENTGGVNLGPVNKAMHMIIVWLEEGPDSHLFKQQLEYYPSYLWMSDRGMMNNGTNGSQLWDTAFFVQAVYESGLAEKAENREMMLRAFEFIDDCQIKDHPPHFQVAYRQLRKGAWPFSTRRQGYTVSDCTAEGLKAVLCLMQLSYTPDLVSEQRLYDAVDVLLSMQNGDGGFASYEVIRGPKLLELINPAEVFGNIMIEYSYVECSTAVLLALSSFSKHYPNYRRKDIQAVKKRVIKFIKSQQREDGSWFGSWGICFTYAGMFAIESLASVGETYVNSIHVRKGCDFLISKQMEDGGWGELYKTCETGVYTPTSKSQVVNTAWAVLALMAAKYPVKEPIRRGIKLIMERQQANGEWLQEHIEGIFNRSCAISYPNYKFAFTIWALGRYARTYGDEKLL